MSKIETKRIGTKEIIREISNRMGCCSKDVRELMDHFTDILVENITSNRKVQFTHLGVFSPPRPKCKRIRFRQSSTIARKLANNGQIAEIEDLNNR